MERKAKNSDAAAVTTPISISSAGKRSTAMTMPKGAGQPPSSYTMIPSWRMRTVSRAATYKTENRHSAATTRCSTRRRRRGSRTTPVSSGISTGKNTKCSRIFAIPSVAAQLVQAVGARLLVRPIRQGQLKRGHAEANDDGGQDERLGHRGGVRVHALLQHGRQTRVETAHEDERKKRPVAQDAAADDDPQQRLLHHEVQPDSEKDAGANRPDGRYRASLAVRPPLRDRRSSTSTFTLPSMVPMTTRNTPKSNRSTVLTSKSRASGTWICQNMDDKKGMPRNMGSTPATAAQASPSTATVR